MLGAEGKVEFDWDEANLTHIARHRVDREEVESALMNDPVDVNYEIVDGEERWSSIGHTAALRVLKIVWAMRGSAPRAIAAWDVSRRSRAEYLKTRKLLR
jgi:uncharacterized protein